MKQDFIQCSDLFKLVHIDLDHASFAYLTFRKHNTEYKIIVLMYFD